MLKAKLTTEPPENLKGAYVQKDGVWVLDDLSDDHPVVVTKTELENTQKGLKSQIDNLTATNGNLERERDEHKGKAIPHGFRAVSKEIAELGEAVKQQGLSKDELGSLKTELDTFRNREAEEGAKALRREAAKSLGYTNEDAFARLAKEMAIEKDGDKFIVKSGEESKPLTKEFIEASDDFKPFLSSLVAQPPKQGNGGDPPPTSGATGFFDRIRESVKSDSKPPVADINARFGKQTV